jgi:phospholipid N-methyltransferase
MQLSKHIAQGKLLHLSQGEESLSVSENEYFRWLAFSNDKGEQVIQSVMHKRKPWKLTLPHQTALLLPLIFFKPKNIVELGLGGGNVDRFLAYTCADALITSIEYSSIVIENFTRYFNPENAVIEIIHSNSNDWLALENKASIDWLICDVYQHREEDSNQTINQLECLLDNIDSNACLSINLPDATDNEVNLCLTVLQQLSSDHVIVYFHIPNYLNIVIHLIPKHWQTFKLLKRNKNCHLPQRLLKQWRKFWLQGNEVGTHVNFK